MTGTASKCTLEAALCGVMYTIVVTLLSEYAPSVYWNFISNCVVELGDMVVGSYSKVAVPVNRFSLVLNAWGIIKLVNPINPKKIRYFINYLEF